MKPFFSVIIPALNEEHYISTLLKALEKQTFKDFEVIVVDAKSEDATIAVVEKFKKSYPLKILTINVRNISISRNKGAKIAKGDFLFFIDSDNSIFPTFLDESKKIIDKKKCEVIITYVTPNSKKKSYRFIYWLVNIFVFVTRIFNMAFASGGNMIIKRDKFEKIGGFNQEIYVGEDHDIVKQAIKEKAKIAVIKNPKLIFSIRRLEKERFTLILKYLFSTLYIVFFGKITHKIYNYQMGGHHFKENDKPIHEK